KRLEKLRDRVEARLAKARANLVLLNPENTPAAQEVIRQFSQERDDIEQELKESKPVPERDINRIVLAILHDLHSLASCCQILADTADGGAVAVGSLEQAAPELVAQRLRQVRRLAGITVHTRIEGEGVRTRHVFD